MQLQGCTIVLMILERDLGPDNLQVGDACPEDVRELSVERMGLTPDWIIQVGRGLLAMANMVSSAAVR